MKKIIFGMLMAISMNAHSMEMWFLIHSQFSDGHFYCTYKLQGTSIETTIVSQNSCDSVITK